MKQQQQMMCQYLTNNLSVDIFLCLKVSKLTLSYRIQILWTHMCSDAYDQVLLDFWTCKTEPTGSSGLCCSERRKQGLKYVLLNIST